jgi:hypothetical protein
MPTVSGKDPCLLRCRGEREPERRVPHEVPESIPPARAMGTCVRLSHLIQDPGAFGLLDVMPILLMVGLDAHDGLGRLLLAWA